MAKYSGLPVRRSFDLQRGNPCLEQAAGFKGPMYRNDSKDGQENRTTEANSPLVGAKENSRKLLLGGTQDFITKETRRVNQIVGHVEKEKLEKMRRCSVGEMATVCSVRSIESTLHEWGLGEIKVKRLGGKFFLLIIEDEDLGWSYLKEIFSSIDLWTEKLGALDRATWLEVSRVLLHCWNHTTLKRIAETWGSFEALGENADHSLDCEKVSVLIKTKMKKISGPVEIAVEHMVYIAVKIICFHPLILR
ncbi:hypothetical protein F3Y22_tig00006992pilonHSYRG00031 [Hibiscus syriacus]|uniref:DUF4283 domain-containing protein n=1 Tax=Hibiscus syriacus TaxID=106335 RepID=A0A6A3CB82_HIBSY|nr:hypothetical protein F3Y22_tig00006992pilonHSYRG00031 [Hibiscus syriacus]